MDERDIETRAAEHLSVTAPSRLNATACDLIIELLQEVRSLRLDLTRAREAQGELLDDERARLKDAFVAGCCAVLTWTHSGMPQDDLDEAGYDYAASVLK